MEYNRYKNFVVDGAYLKVPFIKIPENPTDCYVYYDSSSMRLDLLSYQYYNDSNFGWLILQANPQYGSLEFMIENGSKLRIPYPLDIALQSYETEIKRYNELYGLTN